MLINGKCLKRNKNVFVSNPYTHEIIGKVTALNRKDVANAVFAAKQYDFSLSGNDRYAILSKTASVLWSKKREFAKLITKEIGISLKDSLHETDRAFNVINLSAQEAKNIEEKISLPHIPVSSKVHKNIIIREPVGIICCITPFNHPLNQVVHKICPALAANNAVVLKPSEKSPLTAIKFAELLFENGLPEKMLQVITGESSIVGPALIQNPNIDMISFTGSTHIGGLIMRSCGIKKLSMELGGNDAFVIDNDTDLNKAAEIAVKGAFYNSGQRCSSIKRIILYAQNADKFIELLVDKTRKLVVGDPMDPNTDIGTVVDKRSAIEIERRINEAVKDGAKLLVGGRRKDALLWPAVLDNVNPNSELVTEETFGPVAPIIRTKGFESAVKLVNSTKYGLNAAIMTNNHERALEFAKKVNVGGVRINEAPSFRSEDVPFGGNKMSGFGRSGIKCSVVEMTNLKTIIIK